MKTGDRPISTQARRGAPAIPGEPTGRLASPAEICDCKSFATGDPPMNPRLLLAPALTAWIATAAHAQDAKFTLTVQDHQFQPAELEVPAGQKIELHVVNKDSTAEEFESHELHREKVVPAGQEIVVFIGPLRAGTYEYFGDFHPKTARGHIIAK